MRLMGLSHSLQVGNDLLLALRMRSKGSSDCSWTGFSGGGGGGGGGETHFQKPILTQEGFSSNLMACSTALQLDKSSWPL